MPFGAYAPLPIRLGGTAEEGWTAAQHARLCADLIAAKRVLPYATLSADGTTITAFASMPGMSTALHPVITSAGSNVWAVDFDDGPEDEYEITGPLQIVSARGFSPVSGIIVTCGLSQATSARVIVTLRTHAGGVPPGAKFTLRVWS